MILIKNQIASIKMAHSMKIKLENYAQAKMKMMMKLMELKIQIDKSVI